MFLHDSSWAELASGRTAGHNVHTHNGLSQPADGYPRLARESEGAAKKAAGWQNSVPTAAMHAHLCDHSLNWRPAEGSNETGTVALTSGSEAS